MIATRHRPLIIKHAQVDLQRASLRLMVHLQYGWGLHEDLLVRMLREALHLIKAIDRFHVKTDAFDANELVIEGLIEAH